MVSEAYNKYGDEIHSVQITVVPFFHNIHTDIFSRILYLRARDPLGPLTFNSCALRITVCLHKQ